MSAPDLPGVLADIALLAGRGAALDLALKAGGTDLYVPKDLTDRHEHPIVLAIGAAPELVKFAERYGGNRIYVPHARRALAVHLADRGIRTPDIASILGCSRASVRRYLRGTMVR